MLTFARRTDRLGCQGPPTVVPARRLYDALRDHDFNDASVHGGFTRVVIELDVADANRLAAILNEAAQ